MKRDTTYLIIAIAMAIVAGASLSCAYKHRNEPSKERVDTLVVHDTIRLEKPTEIAAVPNGYELVPIGMVDELQGMVDELQDKVGELVMLADSLERNPKIIVKDSLVYIHIPTEQKIYKGENYKAAVSGYNPTLDWIEIYEQTKTITHEPKRWGIGVTAGFGLSSKGLVPYVGMGVSYDLFQW